MSLKLNFLGALTVALLAATSSASAAIVYNESGSGDLDGNFVTNFFNLTSGTSEFNGQISGALALDGSGNPSFAGGDIDDFFFNVASGFEVISVNLAIDSVSVSGSDPLPAVSFSSDFYIIEQGGATVVDGQFGPELYNNGFFGGPVSLPLVALNSTGLSLGNTSNYYFLGNRLGTSYSSSTNPGSAILATFDYTLSLEVSAVSQVPIPAAAWLFGSALLGLGAMKRKKA
jgi:hypothetical protein